MSFCRRPLTHGVSIPSYDAMYLWYVVTNVSCGLLHGYQTKIFDGRQNPKHLSKFCKIKCMFFLATMCQSKNAGWTSVLCRPFVRAAGCISSTLCACLAAGMTRGIHLESVGIVQVP
jgi:hypothetical protein